MSDEVQALVVTDVFPPEVGGSGELLKNVYTRLLGIPVTFLAPRHDGQTGGTEDGLRVVRGFPRPVHWGVLNPAGLVPHLRRAVRIRRLAAGAPAVVHCGRALPEGLGAWIVSWGGGVRYVCWTHGEELADTSSSRELTALLRTTQRHADVLIANSHHTAGLLEARGVDSGKIRVVHPGVDADRFRPDIEGREALRSQLAEPGELVLMTIGRLQRRKGHDLVLRALALMSRQQPPIRYVIVGDGQEHSALAGLASELGVADRVRFVGAVPAGDLPRYYAAADVFVHPNRVDGHDFEGFGMVFLEAAAAGLPVIAGRSGGVPEAVDADRTGLLVSGTSAEELRDAIDVLGSHPERRREMGAAGRQRVHRDFGWQRAADQVADIHREVARALTSR